MAENNQETIPEKPVTAEITAAGSTVAMSYSHNIPWQISARSMKEWRGFKKDSQVKSCWQQRQLGVSAIEWDVEPGGEDEVDKLAAEDAKEILQAVAFDNAFRKMQEGIFYGFSLSEILWKMDGNRVAIAAIKSRKQERFKWNQKTGQLVMLKDGGGDGEPLPDYKMWVVMAPGENDDEGHGPGLAWQLHWPLFLKKHGLSFWAVFIEKFGMPTAITKFPRLSNKDEQEKALQAALSVHGASAASFPEGFEIDFLEATRGGKDVYESFLAMQDAAIAKIILSQTMTTEDGSSKSQAEVHQGVADMVIQSDADLICQAFNDGPMKWLTAWNHPTAKAPRLVRRNTQEEDLKERAERDKMVAEMSGLRPTQDYIREKFGGEWEEAVSNMNADDAAQVQGDAQRAGTPRQQGNARAAFTDPVGDAVADLTDQVEELLADEQTAFLDGLKTVFDSAGSFEEAEHSMLQFAATRSRNKHAGLVGNALALADLSGRDEVQD